MIRLILIVLSVLCFHIASADVEVVWGNGKLKINDLSGDENLADGLKVLQTEILIKDELFGKILSSSEKVSKISFNQKSESLEDLKAKITNSIMKHKNVVSTKVDEGKNKVNIDVTDDDGGQIQVFDTKGFVVVNKGDEFEVADGEIVDTLIVTGGSVKINGEVKTLVLVKGSVSVGPNGKVTDKITELSGTLQVDQGGFVTSNKSGMLDNFNFSGDLGEFANFAGSSAKLVVIVIRFIQVLFLFWLGFKVVPYINENLFVAKENWAFEGFIGLVHFCLLPFIMFMLAVTVVGLSIVPIYSFLFYIMGLLGYGLISAHLGHKIFEKFCGGSAKKSKYVYLIVGFIIFELLMFIPILGVIILLCLMAVSVGYMTNLITKRKVY